MRYLKLVLRFRRVEPSLVEGEADPELTAQVGAEPEPEPAALAEEVQDLSADVKASNGELEPDRRRWLLAQLGGLEVALRRLAGEQFSYTELTERCHGVRPRLVSEERFAVAHSRLDAVLPGSGPVSERYQRWSATQVVPSELLLPALEALRTELRRRTAERFGLPDGEQASFETVSDKPWAANAEYVGDLRTKIAVNEDGPKQGYRLLDLVAHEAYPGHHAEAVCKQQAGHPELGLCVYPTPQSLISEGVATVALEALLGGEAHEVGAACLRPLGIAYDVEVAAVAADAWNMLWPLRANIALMLDEHGMTIEEAMVYARRWLPEDDSYVEEVIASLGDRTWPPYESCYPEGYELCRGFCAGDPARFARLLRESWLTPADLRSAA